MSRKCANHLDPMFHGMRHKVDKPREIPVSSIETEDVLGRAIDTTDEIKALKKEIAEKRVDLDILNDRLRRLVSESDDNEMVKATTFDGEVLFDFTKGSDIDASPDFPIRHLTFKVQTRWGEKDITIMGSMNPTNEYSIEFQLEDYSLWIAKEESEKIGRLLEWDKPKPNPCPCGGNCKCGKTRKIIDSLEDIADVKIDSDGLYFLVSPNGKVREFTDFGSTKMDHLPKLYELSKSWLLESEKDRLSFDELHNLFIQIVA